MTRRKPIQWIASPEMALAVVTAGLYGSMARSFPVAGSSALYLDKHLWLDGFPIWSHPLWGMLARAVAQAWPEQAIAILNGLGVACGVLIVVLTYRFHEWVLRTLNPGKRQYVCTLGAASSALYLAVSTPMLLLSTRAHPLGLGVAMLLVAVHLMLRYVTRRSRLSLFAFAFLYGVGLIEYAGFTLAAFPVGLSTLFVMWRRQHLRPGVLIPTVLAFGLGLSFLAVVVWQATLSPAQVWMASATPWVLLRAVLGAQLNQVVNALPDVGGLLIFVISIPPYALCLVDSYRHRSSFRRFRSLILYGVVSALTFLVLFNVPGTPWRVLGEPRFVVLPYFFVAGSFGFVVLYWHSAFLRLWEKLDLPHHPARELVIAILPATLVAAPLVTSRDVMPESTRVLYDVADEIVDAAYPCRWLVTDGSLDSLMRLSGRQRGRELVLVSIPRSAQTDYRRYVASSLGTTRLKGLAELGLAPMLKDWMATDEEIADKLAVVGSGDAWLEMGIDPLPDRMVYLGVGPQAGQDLDVLLGSHLGFWSAHAERLWDLERADGLHANAARTLRWRMARAANDLGTYFQRAGRDDLAHTAYTSALTIDERNLSADVNLRALEGREEDPLSPVLAETAGWPLMQIVTRFGHIYRLASLYKVREQTGGVSQDLTGEVRTQILEAAQLYTSGDIQRALDRTTRMIEEGNAPPHAWYLRGLFAAAMEQEDLWEECWAYMEKEKLIWPAFQIVQGARFMKKGMATEALDLYGNAINASPFDPVIVKSVAQAYFHYGTLDAARPYLTQLLSLRPGDAWGNFALGTLQVSAGEFEQAESSLRVAVRGLRLPHAYNNLGWVLSQLGDEEAETWVRKALELQPGFPPALDTLGVLKMREGRYAEARSLFDEVLEVRPADWDARVHLAVLALEEGDLEEARKRTFDLSADRRDASVWQQEEFRALCERTGVRAP